MFTSTGGKKSYYYRGENLTNFREKKVLSPLYWDLLNSQANLYRTMFDVRCSMFDVRFHVDTKIET